MASMLDEGYTPPDTTAMPASTLDSVDGAQVVNWLGAGLGKLLDTYAALDIAHLNAQQAVPTGYYRVPGTSQVQPVGTGAPLQRAGVSASMVLLIGAAVALVFLLKKG